MAINFIFVCLKDRLLRAEHEAGAERENYASDQSGTGGSEERSTNTAWAAGFLSFKSGETPEAKISCGNAVKAATRKKQTHCTRVL